MKLEKAVFSICLGAQMQADITGARIYRLEQKQLGIYKVDIDNPEGFLSAVANNNGRVFQSHQYAFDLPQGAMHLTYSNDVPCQASNMGNHIVATQFHSDATLEVFTSWLLATFFSLRATLGAGHWFRMRMACTVRQLFSPANPSHQSDPLALSAALR